GQRQRVALARAIAVEPRVLLLDEPLTALDAKLRDELRVEIDSLLRRLGITAVYVTHDQQEAMSLGDRIIVMSQGRVAQVGRPRDIYLAPKTRFVADFVGTMNRVRGVAQNGHLLLKTGRLPLKSPASGEIEVLFRPESATVVVAGAGHVTGRVAASFFLGDRVRLILEEIGEGVVVVETGLRQEFQLGQPVGLRIDPAGLLRLD
ncbi:MAG: ABC transporter ATP-binding protein, partial [Candidatus Eiseniibacteriota bacterium]